MPTAYNEKTGEILTLGADGQWVKPQMAENPQTGEKLYLDGSEWKKLPAMASLSEQDRKIESMRLMPRAQSALEQGVTMGFADEVGAAGAATGAFLKNLPQGFDAAKEAAGKRYDERLKGERDLAKEFAEQYPILNTSLVTLGGLGLGPQQQPLAIGASKALPAAQAAPTLGQAARQGAVMGGTYGGITGFGSAEGGLGERLAGAALGGTAGAALGAATPFLAQGAMEGWGAVKNLLNAGNADEQAQQLILRAMQRDNLSVDEAINRYNAGQLTASKPEALIDIGGENVKGLARGAASIPGPARQMTQDFVATRQAGQGGRIADDVANAISSNTNFSGTIDDLMASRARAAQPLYDRVVRPDSLVPDEKFAALAQDPYIAQTIGKVRENPLYGMADLPPNSLPVLDAAKKQLDDLIGAARVSKANNEARLLTQKRDAIVSLADEAFPEYRLAREAWSGPTQSIEAMELGRGILKESADVTAAAIKKLPEGDREFFKAGVVRAIKDAADNAPDGADITKRFFGKPALREKLRAAFDDDAAFQAFEQTIRREAEMFKTAQQVNPRAGSPTAIIQEEQADIRRNPFVQFGMDTFRQGPFQAIGNVASNLYDRGRGINPQTSQKLAEYLLATNPQSVRNTFGTLDATRRMDQQKAIEMARQLGLIAAQEGRFVGGF